MIVEKYSKFFSSKEQTQRFYVLENEIATNFVIQEPRRIVVFQTLSKG